MGVKKEIAADLEIKEESTARSEKRRSRQSV